MKSQDSRRFRAGAFLLSGDRAAGAIKHVRRLSHARTTAAVRVCYGRRNIRFKRQKAKSYGPKGEAVRCLNVACFQQWGEDMELFHGFLLPIYYLCSRLATI
ncbi:MAG: hypothetical protein ACFN4H_07930 [Prevotella sp.]